MSMAKTRLSSRAHVQCSDGLRSSGASRVSGSSETKTYGKGVTMREHKALHTLPRRAILGQLIQATLNSHRRANKGTQTVPHTLFGKVCFHEAKKACLERPRTTVAPYGSFSIFRPNSGARVSEVTALKRDQVCFGTSTFLQLIGKGRKERSVPLWPDTAQVLKAWFAELGDDAGPIAFPNARGKALSREGVDYLLKQAMQRAIPTCPSLATKHLTPHVVRHTTAMHLLQAGVDMATIALWLGHESIETTHMYLQADLAMQEKDWKNSIRLWEYGNASTPMIPC
jgi:hypothetical protein